MTKQKVIALIIGVSILMIIAIYYITGTPQYSTYQFVKAVEAHNVDQAEQYVDIDSIADQVSDAAVSVLNEAIDEQEIAEEDFFGADFYKGILALMIPAFEEELKNQIKEGFVQYVESTDEGENSISSLDKYSGRNLISVMMSDDLSFERNGNIAYLTLHDIESQDSDDIFSLVFKMKKGAGRTWIVDGISNLDDILEQFLDTDELTSDLTAENTEI